MLEHTDCLMPVYIDSVQRLRNCDLIIEHLKKIMKNIYIHETYEDFPKLKGRYDDPGGMYYSGVHYFNQLSDGGLYNQGKSINFLFNQCSSDIISLSEADIVIRSDAFHLAEAMIMKRDADVVNPYDGICWDVPTEIVDRYGLNFPTESAINIFSNSVGGTTLFRRSVFKEGGMANEDFCGYGYEDNERFERFIKLGYKVSKLKQPLFHLHHSRNPSTLYYKKGINTNVIKYKRLHDMSKEQLQEEIKTWAWCK